MVFNSFTFFISLAALLVVMYAIPSMTYRKVVLLLYSYIFYGMWNPIFVILILVSTVTDFLLALLIHRNREYGNLFVKISIALNLGYLGFFKYYDFFVSSTGYLLGVDPSPYVLGFLLPVGISFYTFQSIAYIIDVHRREVEPSRSMLDFALFVAYFGQLVAGPITRARELMPQIVIGPQWKTENIEKGIALTIFGLFLKVVIADNVGPVADQGFANYATNTAIDNWNAAGLFGVQIYGDFCGYSMMAIGISLLFDFHLPRNFNAPYGALGFSDFWRRWHITLSTWLRDYLYISLGGNRQGAARTYFNLMATMVLGGLWHGSSIMFLIWGFLHGTYLCLERIARSVLGTGVPKMNSISAAALTACGLVGTFALVTITWIPFRAKTAEQGFTMMRGLFQNFALPATEQILYMSIYLGLFLLHVALRCVNFMVIFESRSAARAFRTTAIPVMLLCLYFLSGDRVQFIYFQF